MNRPHRSASKEEEIGRTNKPTIIPYVVLHCCVCMRDGNLAKAIVTREVSRVEEEFKIHHVVHDNLNTDVEISDATNLGARGES